MTREMQDYVDRLCACLLAGNGTIPADHVVIQHAYRSGREPIVFIRDFGQMVAMLGDSDTFEFQEAQVNFVRSHPELAANAKAIVRMISGGTDKPS